MIDRTVFEQATFIAALLPDQRENGYTVAVLKSRHTPADPCPGAVARFQALAEPMRLAAGIGRKPLTGNPEDLHYAYMSGWRDAARSLPSGAGPDVFDTRDQAYALGYRDGARALAVAFDAAREWSGFDTHATGNLRECLKGSRSLAVDCPDGGWVVLYERDGAIRRVKITAAGDLVKHIDDPISEVPDGVDADAHAYAVRVLGGDASK